MTSRGNDLAEGSQEDVHQPMSINVELSRLRLTSFRKYSSLSGSNSSRTHFEFYPPIPKPPPLGEGTKGRSMPPKGCSNSPKS
ncbi:hypothetical protein Nepgr_002715 [Nepenthes gracilis]|uniref:Uncharacterized protein n=1 Tax=Nepenthes gracilis TaxID=150966 RepID=A0AAD3RYF5_NEPGR|nr:hypothetical protein Nepgr_002715 [Nepenthes gracilis]